MKQTQIFCVLVAIICVAVLATAVMATAPKLMSYQGRATDASGNPVTDGDHTVRFDLFNSATTGSSLWNEQTSVTTTGGLFTHTLGSVTPILESQFRYYEGLWLQVTFDGQVQTPRTQFTSVGYAFHVQSIHNADGGSINGYMAIYDNTAGNEIAEFYGDANGEPVLNLNGSLRNILLNTGDSASGSVVLPQNAIQSSEIRDEPGIANNVNQFSPALALSIGSRDLVTTSITIPSAGYIVLFAKANFEHPDIGGWWQMQISETHGIPDNSSNTQSFTDDYSNYGYCQRVYYKSSPGAYTFFVEANISVASGPVNVTRSSLLAMFVPTSYGAVSGFVSGQEVGQFDEAEVVNSISGEQMYKVDLRELEIRAAKAEAEAERARADAEKAQRELLRAKYESSKGQSDSQE